MNNSRNPPPVPVRDLDRSKGKEGGQLTSTSPAISPASSQVWITAFITPQSIIRSSKWCRHASRQGSGGWEKVFDEVSGRPYYFNRSTRTTSWNLPEPSSPSPPPGSATHRKHEGGPVRPSLKRWPGSKSEQTQSFFKLWNMSKCHFNNWKTEIRLIFYQLYQVMLGEQVVFVLMRIQGCLIKMVNFLQWLLLLWLLKASPARGRLSCRRP